MRTPERSRSPRSQVRELGHTPTEIAVSLREAAEAIARDDPDLTIVVIYGDDEPRARPHRGDRRLLLRARDRPARPRGPASSWPQAAERGIFAYARQETAESIQSAIEVAMRRWREHHELDEQVERLENALERRAVIERAKGILMERHNLDDRAAFQRRARARPQHQPHGRRRGRRGGRGPRAAAQGERLGRLAHGLPGKPCAAESRGSAQSIPPERSTSVIGIVIAILVAALVYWLCLILGLPSIVGIVAAILVLLGGVGPAATGCVRAGASSPPVETARPTASASGARRCTRSWCARARTSSRTR